MPYRKYRSILAKLTLSVVVLHLTTMPTPAVAQAGGTAAQTQEAQAPSEAQLRSIVASLHPKNGTVQVPAAAASLDLGTAYDFYDEGDARKILVDIWGNAPDSGEGVLGLVMPAGRGPLSDAWGAVISFENTGYVSDSDAQTTNFDEILSDLQQSQIAANTRRREQGYPAMTLVGWAEAPQYKSSTHSVIWARNLAVDGESINSLNYDVRMLGRRGVLSLNLISEMDQLGAVRAAASNFAQHASFNQGARYADFDASTDEEAGYGIAGLIAAGAGVAAAKKLGFLAIFLKFGKVIAVAVAAAFAAFRTKIAALFRRSG